MALLLDGKDLSRRTENKIRGEVLGLSIDKKRLPKLVTIIVGSDPASLTYVDMKHNACKRVGFLSENIALKEETTTEELISIIEKLNEDNSVDGILLQHPCPSQIDEDRCFNTIDVNKDVDGVNSISFGKVSLGEEGFFTATTRGIKELIENYKIDVFAKDVLVIGKSRILGKPTAMMLLNKEATVTNAHINTKDLKEKAKRADIIVACAGSAGLVKEDWIKKDAVIIDAGYNKGNVGDVDLNKKVIDKIKAYTPVPGGVGPMTIASLLLQTLNAYKIREKLN